MTGNPRPRVAIACGGTGGHFYPTLALSKALEARGVHVTLLVAGQHREEHLQLAGEHGVSACGVEAMRLPRGLRAAASFAFVFAGSVRGARRALRESRPGLVLGMGSFAAVPVCLAAAMTRVPLVLHEGNARVGRANRFLSRWARVLAFSLPLVPGQKLGCPSTRTGLPLREGIIEAGRGRAGADLESLRVAMGLEPTVPTVLTFGGSQGAAFLNDLVSQSLARMHSDHARLQIIHLTGTDHNDAFIRRYRDAGIPCVVKKHDPAIETSYLASDVVVCRAGAATVLELALFGRPAVLVPLPTMAANDQTANAQVVVMVDAGVHLAQADATPERLTAILNEWLRDPAAWRDRGERAVKLACPDATEALADLLVECLPAVRRP